MKKSFDKTNYTYGLWINGEITSIHLSYEGALGALEAFKYYEDENSDLMIIDLDTNEVIYEN